MMPGETHSKTAGIASEAAGSCQNCTSLQQSLNEYVAALIAVKQKIIDSDQLLTEYQQKCDDLQYAERENETLRCQLEQMLQKISPQEQHEDELKSLKAELEEKTSTLKIYQQTETEYIKVKEECKKSDIAKKKLEVKLKKMEEAAAKHDKDFKQLKVEKKVIGKELKKIQKMLDGVQSKKSKKVAMKNAQTQYAKEEPVVKLNKQKIRYLLEEIWGCIESSAENGECNLLMLGNLDSHELTIPEIKVKKYKRRGRKPKNSPECELPNHSRLKISQTCNPPAEFDAVQATLNLTGQNDAPYPESAMVVNACNEHATLNVLVSKELSDCSSVNSDFESDMDEILEVQNWSKPLPNLLSPIQGSPPTMKNVFGELTDSSDAESTSAMDQSICNSQLKTANVLQNGTDKNRDLNAEVEHCLLAADNVTVKTTVCFNDGLDLTMEMETSTRNLEQTTPILSLQKAKQVTEDPIHMKFDNTSDHLTRNTTYSEESLTYALKRPKLRCENSQLSERTLSDIENVTVSLDAENEIQYTARHTEKNEIQLDSQVYHSATNELTACCNPSLKITEPDDDVRKIKLNNLTGNNPESPGCFISSKNPITEDSLSHYDLNSDKDVSKSMGRSNVTILDCDQETMLPMQSENCSEKEKSSSLTNLHTKPDMSDDGSTLFKDTKCFNNSGDVDLSKCSEEVSGKTLDTMSTLRLINNFTNETEKMKRQSTEKNCSEYSVQSQPRHSSPLHISSNHLLTVSDCRAHVIDCDNVKENSIYKSGDLEVPADMLDEQNIMDVSLDERDSIMDIAMASHCKTIHKKGGDLEKSSSQKEKILEPEKQNCCDLGMDKMASTSLFPSSDQCEVRSPETDNISTTLGLDVPLALPADVKRKTVLQLPQIDTCRADCASSPEPVICDDHLSLPIITAHLNDKCQQSINTSTDTPTHHPEKCNTEDINLPSVVSPVHMAVDSEHTNKGDRLETQCQEVTKSVESSMDLNSSILEQRNTIFCPLSKAGLIADTASSSSKIMPVPLEELQHLLTPSESKDSFKKLEEDSTEICDASLESSESEYEFPVRKVNFTRSALSNLVVRNEPLKPTSDAINGNIDNSLIIMTELEEQHKLSTLEVDESKGHVTTVIEPSNSYDYKVENDLLIEPDVLVLDTQDTESTNSVTSKGNAVECSPEGITKEPSSLTNTVRQNSVCNDDRSDKDAEENNGSNSETRGRRILPGKNLIWNFSRSEDDFADHRAVCLTQNRKTSSEDVSGNLENSVSRGNVSTGKTQEHYISNNLNSSKFLTARKENPPHRLQGGTDSQNAQVVQTVLANADTSTNTGHSPETINKVRSEMGPPLPPLLGPLLCTPPRRLHTLSPIMSSSSRSSLPSPLDEMISPLPGTPFPPLMSPLCDGRKQKSPVFNTPSPAEKANRRILSSPLQFCAATPKHAVPVPGRLPLCSNGSSACSVQENSVKILDTMYPELSARARTLNILKGNVQLNRGMAGDGQNVPVSQISGFKSITSTSTVFIKTGSNSKTNNDEKPNTCETQLSSESCTSVNKRVIDNFQMPKSAKRLRLDSESPVAERIKDCFTTSAKSLDAQKVDETCQNFSYCESLPDIVKDSSVDEDIIIANALKKVEELCFDLLPVIRSHVYVGTIPNVPVMRNEEKEVIYDFSSSKKGLADSFLHVLLKKIKTGKRSLDSAYLQAMCRVYVGLCRQLGDIERARILCYSILKEDFPDPDKLLLFVISSWNDILSLHGVVSKAIQAVLKNLGKDDVGSCLSAYLNWKKSPPMNVSVLLNSVLMAIQLCPDVKFCQSEKYGEDLTDNVWEYVFAVDLLCSQRKWTWTNENVISKELWPMLDKWVKRKKGNLTIQFVPDIIVATVLRLIGHLCQMGLKEGFITAVKNIASVIITFIKHANEEGVPWGVQLASVYMLCDTAPCDPNLIHQTLQAWKETTKNNMPPAVINCMQEIASLCVQNT